MERREAERVFALVREIGGDLRGRIVSERWWLVWITMGLEILVTCSVTQLLLWRGEWRLLPFAILWGLHVALLPVLVAIIHRKGGGQRTATEGYLWWIWGTYLCCCLGAAFVEQLAGLPLFRTAPFLALLAVFAFSVLAMVAGRHFL
ncbi:MAG TPA: hypothetical protein VK689_03375, partial [Armatimonadota bacterium]|nr:hypothetical protein [Armatimonadota bacterium]